ncbi:Zonular occludens toxin (Zot) [Pseudomonas guineae]|uniref:Zonular occludens toxin (Zot) n=1 Tax=Pseudomonas guineae TaxID=425504 RepID=A0A1I3Q5X6_9PSED|nr:zonular occludens toxin domain-containing protein [Pseudomonas guineae]SFJ29403.1 Zonular occludens toxin (Zot) [Pseudomonas guineae]
MAVYIVTGKLGAGKTLLLILKILDYLKAGRRVAVNVDVKMDKLCKRDNKYSRLIRLPDLPSAADLIGLEFGHDTYDEEKFGGIFLDEAGVWLNSRDWNQGGRTDLLKFFLFLRKRRWDLWLCVQNVNVIDKQIRESIAEHVVYINRWDKLKIPFFLRIPGRLLTLGMWKGNLPKMHQAVVKYGAKFNSPKVEDWFYQGKEFYSFYDTTQEYNKDYDKGSYSMLPPGYWRRLLPPSPRTMGFFMRTSKIFFRRTRVINAFFLGGFIALCISLPGLMAIALVNQPVADAAQPTPVQVLSSTPLADEFSELRIASYGRLAGTVVYVFVDKSGARISTEDLLVRNITVKDRGPREALLVRDADYLSVYR